MTGAVVPAEYPAYTSSATYTANTCSAQWGAGAALTTTHDAQPYVAFADMLCMACASPSVTSLPAEVSYCGCACKQTSMSHLFLQKHQNLAYPPTTCPPFTSILHLLVRIYEVQSSCVGLAHACTGKPSHDRNLKAKPL